MSPVYQDLGAGIGAGVDRFTQNLMNAYLTKRQLAMQQQGAMDAHQTALDAHTQRLIENAVNYNFLPEGTKIDGMDGPAPTLAPPAQAPDMGAFQRLMAHASAGALPPVASPLPAMPTTRRGVTPVSLLDRQTDPSSQFEQTMTDAMQRASGGGGAAAGGSASRAGAGAANIPGNPAGSSGSSRISIPGVGSIDPMAGFNRQILLEQLKAGVATDEKIREAAATGVIDRNTAEAYLARRNASKPQLGDPGYAPAMASVAGAEAQARLPFDVQKAVAEGRISRENGMALEGVRTQVQRELQRNTQEFEVGKITQQQKNERDMAAQRMAAEFFNHVSEMDYAARGTITGKVFGRPPMPTVAPSSQVFDADEQRSAWDAAAATLRAQKKNPDTVLGPRP